MAGAPTDTIFALSSGRPPAAIAVVRVSGSRAFAAATALCGDLPDERHAGLRTLRDPVDQSPIDQALVIRFAGPKTATGEDVVEFQCHGSAAVVARLQLALRNIDGMRAADPGEFTRRALSNGRIDLTEAEGLADLLAAETELQRKVALGRSEGSLRRQLADWRDRLLQLSAHAEVAIDYADEEDGDLGFDFVAPSKDLAAEMESLLAAPRIERLRDGIRVVVAGPPNAGKSSLVNALARGERALVTPIPGTTRDLIEVPISVDGVPLVLVDTAGLRQPGDEVEALGIALADREIAGADLLLWLGTPGDAPSNEHMLRVTNKSDLGMRDEGADHLVSAKTGEGVHELALAIACLAGSMLPQAEGLSLTEREAALLEACRGALEKVGTCVDASIRADELRAARFAIDAMTGGAGIEDVLDALFGRFCLGK